MLIDPTTNLPTHIVYVEHPIKVSDGDWALGVYSNKTIMYSRYPFGGKHQRIEQRGSFQDWDNKQWAWFLMKAKRLEQFTRGLISELNRLRLRY